MRENPQIAADIIDRIRAADESELLVLERALSADNRVTVRKALDAARKRLAAQAKELQRLRALYDFDRSFGNGLVLGLDEVGRGPLAGPLVVGGVVLAPEPIIAGLNDSKRLSPQKRSAVAPEIERNAVAWTVVFVGPDEIDRIGMSRALRKAFGEAVAVIDEAVSDVECILLDGVALHVDPRERNVVKGDSVSAGIAAASIVAKVHRDAYMDDLSKLYPAYGFESNKGYGTDAHRAAIRAYGTCPEHRVSFCSEFFQETLF